MLFNSIFFLLLFLLLILWKFLSFLKLMLMCVSVSVCVSVCVLFHFFSSLVCVCQFDCRHMNYIVKKNKTKREMIFKKKHNHQIDEFQLKEHTQQKFDFSSKSRIRTKHIERHSVLCVCVKLKIREMVWTKRNIKMWI